MEPRRGIPGHDVLGDQQGSRPLSALDFACQLFQKSRAARDRGDLDSLGSQPSCNRAADPDARPGNERGLPDKLQIHDTPPDREADGAKGGDRRCRYASGKVC